MIVEQILNNAQTPLLHIADVSGSALFQGDCLDIMPLIPDNSIDAIITDPPYGTTQCKWDSVIPFDLMWEQLNRIIKPNGAIVLFGSEPFSSALRMSNVKNYKYDWVWNKVISSGFLNANKMPLKIHENILIFVNKGTPTYNAEKHERSFSSNMSGHLNRIGKSYGKGKENVYGSIADVKLINVDEKYKLPDSILTISKGNNRIKKEHPTQKPIELMEYLIKTYTNEGERVLDFTMGAGSTMVASKNLNRKFIGIEKEANYYEIACRRCGF
jgi:site-specific DNA-methyltransferase (adenine-specific)